MNTAHEAISQGYNSAIMHYSILKEKFLKNLEKAYGDAAQEFLNKINSEIIEEINNSTGTSFDEAFVKIKDYFEQNIAQKIVYGRDSDRKVLVEKFRSAVSKNSVKENPKRLKDNMKKAIEQYLNSLGMDRSFFAQLSGVTQAQTNTDMRNQYFGYARQLVLQKLTSMNGGATLNIQVSHFKQALKGYYKEELLVKAFDKVLGQFYGGLKSVKTSDLTNSKSQQIKIDMIIGNGIQISGDAKNEYIDNLIKRLSSIPPQSEGSSSVNIEDLSAGLQSKSWFVPWENSSNKNKGQLILGGASGLMPQGEDAHYWHAGVANVMSNLINVINPGNFLYSTGGDVYWTDELLDRFQKEGYVAAFYWSKRAQKIVNGTVQMLPHDDKNI